MYVIKSIHIKNFRSIVDESINLLDFNCFVGKNDSGKSNVLKALNLFFNGETDYRTPFDFSSDYSRYAKKVVKRAKEISISLEIIIPESYQEKGVKVWTKVWRSEGLHSDNFLSLFKKGSKAFTLLDRIQYLYIPAVKSNEYFKNLLSDVYLSMTKSANSALKSLNNQYSKQLQGLTSALSEQLKNVLGINSAIQMPENLNALFRDLTFATSDKYVKNIDLNHRGDGIRARHIPSILRYMQQNTEQFRPRNSISGTYIWGFEEPENGVEYSSCFEMADELYTYISDCQLLITTHSPAFYMKCSSDKTTRYYVYKKESGNSHYSSDISTDSIDQQIGLLPIISPYIEKEHSKYHENLTLLNNELNHITSLYKTATGKIIIIPEGKTDVKHLKNAFEHLEINKDFLNRIFYYDFRSTDVLGKALTDLLNRLSNLPNQNIIIGIYDRDAIQIANDNEKEYASLGNNVFKFAIPPLSNNERSKTDKICIEHYYSNTEIKHLTPNGRLYMGDDFNTYGISSDGNWVYKDFEKNSSITALSIIDKNCKHLQKISDSSQIITKDDFASYVIEHPDDFNFSNFQKIFDIIKSIDDDTHSS